jgi:hypothetical protein
MDTMNVTAAEFLGPSHAGPLTTKAKVLKISQLAELRKDILQHKPPQGALAALSLADLHSIRQAFAPYSEGDMPKLAAGDTCCCCCCPCCCCGTACSSCC